MLIVRVLHVIEFGYMLVWETHDCNIWDIDFFFSANIYTHYLYTVNAKLM